MINLLSAKKVYEDGTSLREATIALEYLSGEELDLLAQPQNRIYPEIVWINDI